ncbi:MAG: hypothetical protein M1819_003108 [Sarea resinae]|nr:MAG: hypothetical protein M1819_003108 [Sarea resinae]
MGRSIESSRPFLRNSTRSSLRFSTISHTPSLTPSTNTLSTTGYYNDLPLAQIKEWTDTFDRLTEKRLVQQRFVPSPEKTEDLNKLALGAKIDRALSRRMSGQDAVWRKKVYNEKTGLVELRHK